MKSPLIMFGYAAVLVTFGLIAYFMAPPEANALTALIIPVIAAGLMVVFASMAAALHRNRTVGMVGIHVGMVLPIVFAIAFGFRAYGTFGAGEERRYLAIILTILTAASVLAFIAILLTRPKPEARA